MSKNIRFVVRQGRCVATSVARSINNDLRFKRGLLETDDKTSNRLPVELIEPEVGTEGQSTVVTFRYEGGTLVQVRLFDRSQLLGGGDQEDWAVYSASARYYHLNGAYARVSDVKLETEFDADALAQLGTSAMGWYHPHVNDRQDITSEVGVFWNNGAGDGYVDPDYDRNQQGHYTLYDSVPYAVLIPGDRERAISEAEAKLATY